MGFSVKTMSLDLLISTQNSLKESRFTKPWNYILWKNHLGKQLNTNYTGMLLSFLKWTIIYNIMYLDRGLSYRMFFNRHGNVCMCSACNVSHMTWSVAIMLQPLCCSMWTENLTLIINKSTVKSVSSQRTVGWILVRCVQATNGSCCCPRYTSMTLEADA